MAENVIYVAFGNSAGEQPDLPENIDDTKRRIGVEILAGLLETNQGITTEPSSLSERNQTYLAELSAKLRPPTSR